MAFAVTKRQWGMQDLGIQPLGASDQRSFETAYTLLNEPEHFSCHEIIFASSITFSQDILFTLVGAHYKEIKLKLGNVISHVNTATVYSASAGDTLTLNKRQKGFRLYLMAIERKKNNESLFMRTRGAFEQWFSPPPATLRILKGVEYSYLDNPIQFLDQSWHYSNASDLSGIRLDGKSMQASSYDIISSAVSDGTVQLTRNGPIILMRHRQTIGGYPRIFQLAAADIDTLAQYPPGSLLHFQLIEANEAKTLLQKYETEIEQFKAAFAR